MDIGLIIFDWAGTLVDFGCRAPVAAFQQAFENAGLPVSEAVARRPMGAHKRDHVREILGDADVAERVRTRLRREPDEFLVDEIYREFSRLLPPFMAAHADAIPGAAETLRWLRGRGIRIGSTTGYTRTMMEALEPLARAEGIAPELVICADQVPHGRSAPWACFRIAEQCGVYPMSRCVKIGDTPADMAEGTNAGMICVGVSESGNEVGLGPEALAALSSDERSQRVAAAENRLRAAGASSVLRSVAELRGWIEAHDGAG